MPEEKERETLTFEQAMERLEKIVTQIEGGDITLEASIDRYAEGTKLIKQCRTILDKAEQKIQLLTKGEGETLEPSGELEELDT